ncbi:hypothetical protein B566_EDAN011932, partial [Ephemera danica]
MKIWLQLLLFVYWFALAASEGVEHVFPANAETTYKWTAEVSTGVTLPESNDNHASYFAFNANLRVRTDGTNKVFFKHVFPANAETTYKWTAEVSTGVTLPESNDNHASYFAFNANLRVRTDGTNKVFFKIEDMTHSAYNGPVEKNKSPKDGHTCGTIFAAVYEKGQRGVTGLCHVKQSVLSHKDEDYVSLRKFYNNNNCTEKPEKKDDLSFHQCGQSTWNPASHTTERNYKLSTNGKLFVKTIKSRSAIITQPEGMDTETYFHVTKQNVEITSSGPVHDDVWETGKTISTSLVFEFPTENMETGEDIDFSFGKILYEPEITVNKNPASHTTERNYKLSTNGKLFVKTIKSRSAIITQPEGMDTETYFHVTKQNVEITSSEPVHDDVWASGKTISTSLVFEFPTENMETGEDIDLSFGKILYEPEITVNKTMLIFKQVAEHLKDKKYLSNEQMHGFSTKREIAEWYLRSMNTETLKTLAEMIAKTEDKAIRRVALDMFPRIGTLAAVRVIMDLKGKVKDLEFVTMLMEMPFHLRHRSLELIQVCKEMMKFGTDPELLAFGVIVGEVCENTNACPQISTIVKLAFDEIQAQEDYNTKLMLIQFLGNIHLETVAEHLEPLIRDKVNYPHNLRFAAVWAAYHTQVKHPDKAYEFYWPILEDETEHYDMRQAALSVLLHSSPTTERFLNLLWYMNSIENPDIYNMFYTTVKSLLETKHPCFQQLSLSAEEIFRLMPERKVPSFASFNMIMDYKDPISGNG